MTFDGFSDQALAFLAALPTRDPRWFKANKADYERLVVGPTKAFVVELGEELRADVPALVADPKTNGSIAPINNDLRFSPDKAPYKDHLLLKFWEGAPKKTAPTLYVRIAPGDVGFATGVLPADVETWRAAIDSPVGETLATAVDELARAKKADIAGEGLKRVPPPYSADHPRADLLRHKMLQVRWSEKAPASIAKPAFVGWCRKRLEACLPVHRALVEAFG